MGADNWTTCPRCRKKLLQTKRSAELKLTDQYGKLTPAEFLKASADVAAMPVEPDAEHLREDYSIGMGDGGVFYVSYSCSCQRCSFVYRFKQEANALVPS